MQKALVLVLDFGKTGGKEIPEKKAKRLKALCFGKKRVFEPSCICIHKKYAKNA